MGNTAVIIVSVICFVYLLTLLVFTVCRFFLNDREERYEFLKKFKKGSCFLVYFASIPLYFIANLYNGTALFSSLSSSLSNGVELIVLKADWVLVKPLMQNNVIFMITFYFCYALVIVNSFLFVFAIKGMDIINLINFKRALSQKDCVDVVVGYNDGNKQIVSSITKKGKIAILLADKERYLDKESIRKFTYDYKAVCKKYSLSEFKKFLEKKLGKYINIKPINIIINTDDEQENLLLANELADFIIDKNQVDAVDAISRKGINGYVFCQPENMSSFIRLVEKTKGCIQYVNKYKEIAIDFVNKHPIAKLVPERESNLPIVDKDVNLNMIMIGFGKLNRQILTTSVSTEQFVCLNGNEIVNKPVCYCIYDNYAGITEKNLNHNYSRFEHFIKENDQKEFLPFADLPAKIQLHKTDINDEEFYESVRKDISGENTYSYIIVSFGSDLANLDLAEKLAVKVREWGQKKVKIFVKVRSRELAEKFLTEEQITFFGNESSSVYNVDKIAMQEFELMAKQRHLSYVKEGRENLSNEQILNVAKEKWYKKNSQVQRDSNVYACLSLRGKLNLLGYDFVKGEFDDNETVKNFLHAYQDGDPIKWQEKGVGDRKFIAYNNADFDKISARKIYAVLEHQRWNANHICWGFVPASKKEILNDKFDNGKDFSIRRHGCLTTFEGLKEFRKLVADSSGKDLEQSDVIRYDYQLMDEVVWLLHDNGYKLVKL